jgi:putative spermidine/putrescine transport system substrate-binding protein
LSIRSKSGARWLGAALIFSSAYAVAAGDLTVISFGRADRAALVKAYVDPFARSTGINTHSLSYDGQVTELTQMVQAGAPIWDVMQVESRTLAQGCRLGLFEKLDPVRLALPKDLIPGTVSECGVGIFAWSQALVYSDRLKEPPRSWADFWDTRKFPGKRGLRRSAKYTLEIALMADGVALKDVYRTLSTAAGVDRAFRKLEQIKNDTVWWEAAAQPGALMAAGFVNMSSAYTLWFDPDKEKNQHTQIVWNESLYDIASSHSRARRNSRRCCPKISPTVRRTARRSIYCRRKSPVICPHPPPISPTRYGSTRHSGSNMAMRSKGASTTGLRPCADSKKTRMTITSTNRSARIRGASYELTRTSARARSASPAIRKRRHGPSP